MNVHTGADAGGTHGNRPTDTQGTKTNECPHGGGRRRVARQQNNRHTTKEQMLVHTEADAGPGHGKYNKTLMQQEQGHENTHANER